MAKSGEVWCEGARIFLNPCSSLFSLPNAAKCLNLAVFFTPQYGDSYIEVQNTGYFVIVGSTIEYADIAKFHSFG